MSLAGVSVPSTQPVGIPSLTSLFSRLMPTDLAMDLGTANTLIYARNYGILLNQPSMVAVDRESGQALAVGQEAKEMYGRIGDSIKCVRPMKDGVIADFEMTSRMIRFMLGQARKRWSFWRPRLVIGVPSGITQVEKRAVVDAAMCSGVRQVHLVEEPMAAALGAKLPVDEAIGNMIVDIGGGTTEVAIISLKGTVCSQSSRVAGDEMDEAIQRYLKRHFGLDISLFEAERLKISIGSALPLGEVRLTRTHGRDIKTGLPLRANVSDEVIRDALNEPISTISSTVIRVLEDANPEIAEDIISRGVYLAGGGALVKGLAERLERETGIRFYQAEDPLSCVARGVGRVIDHFPEMRDYCIS